MLQSINTADDAVECHCSESIGEKGNRLYEKTVDTTHEHGTQRHAKLFLLTGSAY